MPDAAIDKTRAQHDAVFAEGDRPISLRDAKIKLEVWVNELAAAEKEATHLDAKIAALNRIILKLDAQQSELMREAAGPLAAMGLPGMPKF